MDQLGIYFLYRFYTIIAKDNKLDEAQKITYSQKNSSYFIFLIAGFILFFLHIIFKIFNFPELPLDYELIYAFIILLGAYTFYISIKYDDENFKQKITIEYPEKLNETEEEIVEKAYLFKLIYYLFVFIDIGLILILSIINSYFNIINSD